MDAVGQPPLLWGRWHATANERLWIAECAACSGELWIHRNGDDDWRASCENGCPRATIEAAADRLLAAQRERQNFEQEARETMDPDDPFYGLPAEEYIAALTGQEATRGFFRCPFHSGGQERTPSLHATGIFWYCQGCHLGGTVYDFGAALWEIVPRREGFSEIRRRLYGELLEGAL